MPPTLGKIASDQELEGIAKIGDGLVLDPFAAQMS